MNRLDINGVTSKISRNPKPILFIDTCSLLDIIRIPIRRESGNTAVRVLNTVKDIFSSLKNGDIWVVTSPPVLEEWNDHKQKWIDKLKSHWHSIDVDSAVAHAVCTSSLIGAQNMNRPPAFSNHNYEQPLIDIPKGILRESVYLKEDRDCLKRGYNRVKKSVPPASKGKAWKDSVIIEHYLEVSREIEKTSFSENKIFLTSNTQDFSEDGDPKPPMDRQFNQAGIKLVMNWEWAKNEIGV